MDSGERRGNQRVVVNESVVLRRADGASMPVRCENLSLGGTALLMPTRLYLDQKLSLELPFLGRKLPPFTASVSYVIGLSYPSGMHRVGLAFGALTPEQSAALKSYLDERLSPKSPSRTQLLTV